MNRYLLKGLSWVGVEGEGRAQGAASQPIHSLQRVSPMGMETQSLHTSSKPRTERRAHWLQKASDTAPHVFSAMWGSPRGAVQDGGVYNWLSPALASTASQLSPHACMCAKSLQSYSTLCKTLECSLPGSSVRGILQARILEWVAMPSSRGSSWPKDWTCVS